LLQDNPDIPVANRLNQSGKSMLVYSTPRSKAYLVYPGLVVNASDGSQPVGYKSRDKSAVFSLGDDWRWHPVRDPNTFEAMGYGWDEVVQLPTEVMDAFELGTDYYYDLHLVRVSNHLQIVLTSLDNSNIEAAMTDSEEFDRYPTADELAMYESETSLGYTAVPVNCVPDDIRIIKLLPSTFPPSDFESLGSAGTMEVVPAEADGLKGVINIKDRYSLKCWSGTAFKVCLQVPACNAGQPFVIAGYFGVNTLVNAPEKQLKAWLEKTGDPKHYPILDVSGNPVSLTLVSDAIPGVMYYCVSKPFYLPQTAANSEDNSQITFFFDKYGEDDLLIHGLALRYVSREEANISWPQSFVLPTDGNLVWNGDFSYGAVYWTYENSCDSDGKGFKYFLDSSQIPNNLCIRSVSYTHLTLPTIYSV